MKDRKIYEGYDFSSIDMILIKNLQYGGLSFFSNTRFNPVLRKNRILVSFVRKLAHVGIIYVSNK